MRKINTPKIFLTISGLQGVLNASFEMANRLQSAGYEVVILSMEKRRETVEGEGWRFLPLVDLKIEEKADKHPLANSKKRWQRVYARWQNRKQAQQDALMQLRPSAFVQLLKDERPDLLIVDLELHQFIFAGYAQKIPVLLLNQFYSLWHRKGLPPLPSAIIPGQGFQGSFVGIELSWLRIKLKRWKQFKKMSLLSFETSRRDVLLSYAKEVGFPYRYIRQNFWPGPFSYSQLPILVMAPLEMELPHSPSANLSYIGPMVNANRKEPQTTDYANRTITELARKAKASQQTVIVASGTTMRLGDQAFIQKLLEVARNNPNWLLLIGPVAESQLPALRPVPENAAIFSFLPQLSALAIAQLAICHGGIHSLHECLHFKVPMLMYSGEKSDQNGCSARVHFHRLGLMKNRKTATPELISNSIEEIMADSNIDQRLQHMADHIQAYKDNEILEQRVNAALENVKSNRKDY